MDLVPLDMIQYPEKINIEFYNMIKKLSIDAKNKFWKGGQI